MEEAIATAITNLAPLFGGSVGVAYITASTNYFTAIFFHSAVMFVPFVATRVFLLSRYDFKVPEVFLLFRLLGTLAEAFLNPYALVSGFWFFVFGLMIYLPTFALPDRPNLKRPGVAACLIAIILPILISAPLSLLVVKLREIAGVMSFNG